MEETEILLTVAEIGVALAGFASLAAILGRRDRHTDPLVNAIRLRGLLDAGLSAMLLALVGVLMLQIGGANDWVWQPAGAVGVLMVGTIGTAAFRREKLRRHLPGFRRLASAVMFTLVATAFVGFALVSVGFVRHYGFHVYLGMLLLLLVICCTMFVLVIASLINTRRPQDWQQDVGHRQ